MVYYMELNQGEIIQKPKMQALSALFMTHCLIVMYAPVKIHVYSIRFWSYGPDTKVGRTDGRIGGGIKNARVVSLFMTYQLNVMHAPV